MKKFLLLVWFMISIVILKANIYSKNDISKYLDIKEKYIKNKSEEDYSKLLEYYEESYFDKSKIREMKEKLNNFFIEKKDKEAVNYFEENSQFVSYEYYLSNFMEECENTECSERLIGLYKYWYELTGDIEKYATILDYKEKLETKKRKEKEAVVWSSE